MLSVRQLRRFPHRAHPNNTSFNDATILITILDPCTSAKTRPQGYFQDALPGLDG
jgi:hypothetical protein